MPDANMDLEGLFGEIFSASPDGVLVIDASHHIVLVSPAATVLFGYSPEELLGQSIDILVPDSRREAHGGHLRRYFEAPRPREMGVGLELAGRRRDGAEFPIDVSLTPVNMHGAWYVAAYVRDARDRRRILDRVHAVNEIIKMLVKDGVEAHLQVLLAEHVELLGAGYTLVRREYMTPIGPVDLLCRDDQGRSVAVEIKRRGEIDGVEQLTRYLDLLNRDSLLAPVSGVFAAQQIKPGENISD